MDAGVIARLAAVHWLAHNLTALWKQRFQGEALFHVRHLLSNRLNFALQPKPKSAINVPPHQSHCWVELVFSGNISGGFPVFHDKDG